MCLTHTFAHATKLRDKGDLEGLFNLLVKIMDDYAADVYDIERPSDYGFGVEDYDEYSTEEG